MNENDPPKVLLVDDEATGRRLLRRWIERGFGGKVVEADNGLQALEALAAEEFDLVVLDLMMPVLDGTETLSLIRSDPNHGHLEVVVATQLASEQKVRDIISLGVADYILKPLRYGPVVERLNQIVNRAREKKKERNRQNELATVLIADPDPSFCDFAAAALSGRFRGIAVRTASETIVGILKNEPKLVLLSPKLPGLPFDTLAKKVLAQAAARHGSVGLITDSGSDEIDPSFVGQVARTFVPESFSADVAKLLAGAAVTGENPWLRALEPEVTSALRQAFGMMTGVEPAPADAPPASQAELFATILLQASNGEFDLLLELQCQRAFAVDLCTTIVGGGAEDVDQEAMQSRLGEILNAVGGRIKNSCENRRIQLTLGLPELTDAPPAELDSFYTWELNFTWKHELWFRLRLLGAAGTARPAEVEAAAEDSAAADEATAQPATAPLAADVAPEPTAAPDGGSGQAEPAPDPKPQAGANDSEDASIVDTEIAKSGHAIEEKP